jgi:hypothetical protein
MKLKYEKTHADRAREVSDIRRSPIMRFLKHQDYFKFNMGDILVKQRRLTLNSKWETEVVAGVNTPKKFMYVFENELGIGYVKQLRVDGSGFTSALVCTANFDPDSVRFMIDPDFVDHLLIGEDNDYEYNKEYSNKKAFREDAIKKNTKILVHTRSLKKRIDWLSSLKKGDIFWAGDTLDRMVKQKFRVITPVGDAAPLTMVAEVLEHDRLNIGVTPYFNEDYFARAKVTMQQPFPMEDPLCDRPK